MDIRTATRTGSSGSVSGVKRRSLPLSSSQARITRRLPQAAGVKAGGSGGFLGGRNSKGNNYTRSTIYGVYYNCVCNYVIYFVGREVRWSSGILLRMWSIKNEEIHRPKQWCDQLEWCVSHRKSGCFLKSGLRVVSEFFVGCSSQA